MSNYRIDFTQVAINSISKFKKSRPLQYKKLVKLLNELMVTVLVLSVEGHYADK